MQIFSIGIIIADLCFVVTKSARKARRKKKVKHMEKMRLIQSVREWQLLLLRRNLVTLKQFTGKLTHI